MRFVRKELSISTVCDKDISDNIEILEVLNNLHQYNVEFLFEYKKFFDSDYDYTSFRYSRVRIDKINKDDSKIDVIVLDNKAKVKLRGINFDDILFVSAITKKSDLLKTYKNNSRFDFIDLTE